MMGLEYLQTRGLIETPLIKPCDLSSVFPEINNLMVGENLTRIDKKFLSFLGPHSSKFQDFYSLYHFTGRTSQFKDFEGNIYLSFSGMFTKNISFNQGMRFRFGSVIDSLGPTPWKDFAQAYLNEGNLRIFNEKINFILGRRNLLLGPGDEHSLLLSPSPEGYDGYLFQFTGKYYEFSTTFSALDIDREKFLATHRLGLKFSSLRLGFAEAILWNDGLQPIYLNFFLPYYLSQWGSDRNDNIMWCFDGLLQFSNTILYGEFLIDDYQYSEPPPGFDEYPHKLAFQWGIKKVINESFYLKINYTFVDKWVYTHRIAENVYENDSIPLGFPLGNDVDKFLAVFKFINISNFFPRLNFEFVRKGAGSIFVPYEVERGPANPPFPSPVAENHLKMTFGIESFWSSKLFFDIETGAEFYKNFGHEPGIDKRENIFNARLCILI